MEPREPVVTYNGEDRSEAAGHGVASERSETRRRELRAGVARVFGVSGILKQCGIFEPRFMPPLRGSLLFLGAVPGVPPLTGLHRRAIVWRPSGAQI